MFGTSIGLGGRPGGRCQKRPRCVPVGNVGHDVELLARVLERTLEREVVVRAHDELMWSAALVKKLGELGEEPVERRGLDGGLEQPVQLVVSGPEPFIVATYCDTRARSTGRSSGTEKACARWAARSLDAVEARAQDDAPASSAPMISASSSTADDTPGAAIPPRDAGSPTGAASAPGRLDAELLDEACARVLIRVERFRLPSRAVEREHELAAQGLAERVLAHERSSSRDVTVAAEVEIGLDPLLVRDEPELLEPADLGLREVLERELGECGAAPQRQRLLDQRTPFLGICPSRISEENLEPSSVDLLGCDAEQYPGARVSSMSAPSSRLSREIGSEARSSPSSAPLRPRRGRRAGPSR